MATEQAYSGWQEQACSAVETESSEGRESDLGQEASSADRNVELQGIKKVSTVPSFTHPS